MSSVVATRPRRSPTTDARRAPAAKPAAHHLTAKAGAAGATLVAGGLGLGAVITHEGAAATGELGLDTALSHDRLSPLVSLAHGIDVVIGPIVGPLLVAIVAALLFVRHRRAAVIFALSTAGLWLATSSLKLVFTRARPPADQVHALVHETARDSFPSGHTALAAAIVAGVFFAARSLGRSTRLVLAIGIPFALIVAASRLYLGAHFLGDVTASLVFVTGFALVGAALAPLVARRLDH